MKYRLLLVLFLVLFCADNHIIQRAASDYFPLAEGNWWRYSSDTDTLCVEVEPKDTIMQVECFPVTFGGAVKYLTRFDRSISEYIKRIYNFVGNDYTIIENFITRIELPLVEENTYRDSLYDSLDVSGQWIKIKYEVQGLVSNYEYEESYGDVYQLDLTMVETLITPDTMIIDTNHVVEFYAPDIGLVRFQNGAGEYSLIEYNIP